MVSAAEFWNYLIHIDTGAPAAGPVQWYNLEYYVAASNAPKVIGAGPSGWGQLPGMGQYMTAWWPILEQYYSFSKAQLSKMPPLPAGVLFSLQDLALMSREWTLRFGASNPSRPKGWTSCGVKEQHSSPIPIDEDFGADRYQQVPNWYSGDTWLKHAYGINTSSMVVTNGGEVSDVVVDSTAQTITILTRRGVITKYHNNFGPKGTKGRLRAKLIFTRCGTGTGATVMVSVTNTNISQNSFKAYYDGAADIVKCNAFDSTDYHTFTWDELVGQEITIQCDTEQTPTAQILKFTLYSIDGTTLLRTWSKTYAVGAFPDLSYFIVQSDANAGMPDDWIETKWRDWQVSSPDCPLVKGIKLTQVKNLIIYGYPPRISEEPPRVNIFNGAPVMVGPVTTTQVSGATQSVFELSKMPSGTNVWSVDYGYAPNSGTGVMERVANVAFADCLAYAVYIHDTWSSGYGVYPYHPFTSGYPVTAVSYDFFECIKPGLYYRNATVGDVTCQLVDSAGIMEVISDKVEVCVQYTYSTRSRNVPDTILEWVLYYIENKEIDGTGLYLEDSQITPEMKTALNSIADTTYRFISPGEHSMVYAMAQTAITMVCDSIIDYLTFGECDDAAGISEAEIINMTVNISSGTKDFGEIYANRISGDFFSTDYQEAWDLVMTLMRRAQKANTLLALLRAGAATGDLNSTISSITALLADTLDAEYKETSLLMSMLGTGEQKRAMLQAYYDVEITSNDVTRSVSELADSVEQNWNVLKTGSFLELAVKKDWDQFNANVKFGTVIDHDALYVMPNHLDGTGLTQQILKRSFDGPGESSQLWQGLSVPNEYIRTKGALTSSSWPINWYVDSMTMPIHDVEDYNYNPNGEVPGMADPIYGYQVKIPAFDDIAIVPGTDGSTQLPGRYIIVPFPYFDIMLVSRDYIPGASPTCLLTISIHPRIKGGNDAEIVAQIAEAINQFGAYVKLINAAYRPTDVVVVHNINASDITDALDTIKEQTGWLGVNEILGDIGVGAGAGAAFGALVGSIVPGLGTVVGAVIGMTVGMVLPVAENVVIASENDVPLMKVYQEQGINNSVNIQNYSSWGWMLENSLIFELNGTLLTPAEAELWIGDVLAGWVVNGGVHLVRSVPDLTGSCSLPGYHRPSFKFQWKTVEEDQARFYMAAAGTAIALTAGLLIRYSMAKKTRKVKAVVYFDVLGLTRYNLLDRSRIKKASKTYDLVDTLFEQTMSEFDQSQASIDSLSEDLQEHDAHISDQSDQQTVDLLAAQTQTEADIISSIDEGNANVISSLKRPIFWKKCSSGSSGVNAARKK